MYGAYQANFVVGQKARAKVYRACRLNGGLGRVRVALWASKGFEVLRETLPKAFGKTSRASKASNASRRCIMCKESQVEANYKDISPHDSGLLSSDRQSAHKVQSHGSSNYVGKLISKALSSPENAMAMISIEESESIWQRRHPVEKSGENRRKWSRGESQGEKEEKVPRRESIESQMKKKVNENSDSVTQLPVQRSVAKR